MSHTRDNAASDTAEGVGNRTEPETTATRAWLAGRVAEHLRMSPGDLSPDTALSEYGLDSVYALSVAADLEDHLGVTVDPTVLWDNPTLNALCEAVEGSAGPAIPGPASAIPGPAIPAPTTPASAPPGPATAAPASPASVTPGPTTPAPVTPEPAPVTPLPAASSVSAGGEAADVRVAVR